MYLFLLRKGLPFTLTFVVGTALGGLSWLFGGAGKKAGTVVVTRTYDFKRGCDSSRRRHKLVAETKPLVILDVPAARWPRGVMMPGVKSSSVRVNVTFGADGKVAEVVPVEGWLQNARVQTGVATPVWYAVESAARQIRFTPEMFNSVPVSVTDTVDIYFLND